MVHAGVYDCEWIIVGGRSGRKPFKPPIDWINRVRKGAETAGIPLFIKSNVGCPEIVQQYPKQLIMPWEKSF